MSHMLQPLSARERTAFWYGVRVGWIGGVAFAVLAMLGAYVLHRLA